MNGPSDEKCEKLARLASQMTKVCQIDDALDIVKSFLPSETELTTVQDSYKHLTASFICPKLTFIVDEVKFPRLWPQHVIDFYFSVSIFSYDYFFLIVCKGQTISRFAGLCLFSIRLICSES